jgi:hypothetical protein
MTEVKCKCVTWPAIQKKITKLNTEYNKAVKCNDMFRLKIPHSMIRIIHIGHKVKFDAIFPKFIENINDTYAIDVENSFPPVKGEPQLPALIQIARLSDMNTILLRVMNVTILPNELQAFLKSKKYKKIGYGLAGDVAILNKTYNITLVCKDIQPNYGGIGLKRAALSNNIDMLYYTLKPTTFPTFSKWQTTDRLCNCQIHYAALDVIVPLLLLRIATEC